VCSNAVGAVYIAKTWLIGGNDIVKLRNTTRWIKTNVMAFGGYDVQQQSIVDKIINMLQDPTYKFELITKT